MDLTPQQIEELMDVLSRDDPNEKRRHERQGVELLGCSPAHGMEEVFVSDISAKGARFRTDIRLRREQMLRVLIEKEDLSMTLVLKVIRRDAFDGSTFTYGAEILELVRA